MGNLDLGDLADRGSPFSVPLAKLHLSPPLLDAMQRFARRDLDVRHWKRYPNVSESVKDSIAVCDEMSARFIGNLVREGFLSSMVIEASDAPIPLTDYHQWCRIEDNGRTVNIDWTARQYENLEYPANPQHLLIPCPLVWIGDGPEHPVVPFTVQRIVDA